MLLHPKSRDEWLQIRRAHISSTESAALFGLSKYSTAFELAVRKRDNLGDDADNTRSQWGTLMQATIAKRFAEERGLKVRALNAYSSVNGMGASFDYEIVGGARPTAREENTQEEFTSFAQLYAEHGVGVLEIKNVDAWIYRDEWIDGEAPAHIEIQVQHQLECLQRDWAVIAVLIGGNRLETLTRLRDADVGAAISRKVQAFWQNFNAGVLPPVRLPEDAEMVSYLYRYAEPGKILDAQEMPAVVEAVVQYSEAQQSEKRAGEAKATAKATLLQLIGDAERVLVPGYSVSAGVVAETEVPAYTRKGYRNLRVTAKKEKAT